MTKEKFTALVKGDENEGGDIISFFEEIVDEKNLSIDLDFAYLADSKQKQLIKLVKIPDAYSVLLGKDILVLINQTFFDSIDDDEVKKILMEQELDKVEVNLEKGTVKIGKHGVSTSFGMVEKYTFENVQRAIEMENKVEEQLNEKKSEE